VVARENVPHDVGAHPGLFERTYVCEPAAIPLGT
jgi:hypothetical protein